MDELPPPFFIGHHDPKRPLPITQEHVQQTFAANYDMLTSPITTTHFHTRVLSLLSSSLHHDVSNDSLDITRTQNACPVVIPPLTPPDTPLSPEEYLNSIVATTSTWIDLGSPDPIIAEISRQVFKLELNYAAFCGISHVLISSPRLDGYGVDAEGIVQYARAVRDAIDQAPYMQFYVSLPMFDHPDNTTEQVGDLNSFARRTSTAHGDGKSSGLDLFGSWEAWEMIRSICKYPSRLYVALSLPKLLPPVQLQLRWYSEPIRFLVLNGNVFSKNAKGYPVLSKAHQALISQFIRLRNPPWFLLSGVGPIRAVQDIHGNTTPGQSSFEPSAFPTPAEASGDAHLKDPNPHISYMRNLQTKQPVLTALDKFGAGYQDYLQAPLQPLTVNLESITYEVFEKDPIKYEWYERAIARALHDWIEQGKPTSNPDGRVVVAVVGAGRGPLITRALKAADDVGVAIDMWGLEKNPNAYVLLQRHNQMTWNGRVNLVHSDMRTWKGPLSQENTDKIQRIYNRDDDEEEVDADDAATPPPATTFTGSSETDETYLLATATRQPRHYKIDILISELLGSFADNELSPECLDGVQHLLNPIHGISIPASYSAHFTPIAAPKLHADISQTIINTNPNAAEIPYVVMFNAIDHLSTHTSPPSAPTSPQPNSPSTPTTTTPTPLVARAWSFQHPNHHLPLATSTSITSEPNISNAHNARHCSATFPISNRSTCHGLAGYFETVLYGTVELSTNPLTMDRKSEGMISWFPIFFPLKTPLYVPDNSELVINMWRKTDDRKVWYEWIVDAYAVATPGRRRYRIGGSKLHSSEKEACLM